MLLATPLRAQVAPGTVDAGEEPNPAALITPRTVSTTRQFIVYHEDAQLRSVIARNAEKIKSAWLELLGLRDHWQMPVAIHLSRPETRTAVGEYARLTTYETEAGIHFELSVVINDSFSGDLFTEELVSALYREYAYRSNPALARGTAVVNPPRWLIIGTSAYIRQNHTDLPPDLFDSLIRTDQLLTLRKFLETGLAADSDSTTRKVYGAYALAFVQMLRNSSSGKEGLQKLTRGMADLKPDLAPTDLGVYFKGLGTDPKDLEKWWTVNLAKSSTLGTFRMLDAAESERRLEEYLEVDVPEGDGEHVLRYRLEEWEEYLSLPNSRLGLLLTAEKLAHLSVVCSPLFTPVVSDYLLVVEKLVNDKPKRLAEEIPAKLEQLAAERPLLLTKSVEVEDYLNWFEATKMPQVSGAFDEYLRISRAPLPMYQMRKDSITLYMNGVEYRNAVDRRLERERRPGLQTDPVLRQEDRFQENYSTISRRGRVENY